MRFLSPGDLSVYLHVPFCLSKCPYCDFYSATVGALGAAPPEYFDLVERELGLLERQIEGLRSRAVVTFYIGGGTPSLIEPALYRRLGERLKKAFVFAPDVEWTLEINPGTVGQKRTLDQKQNSPTEAEQDWLEEWLRLGVNRLSVGVQSFSDRTLERLGRAHRTAETEALLEALQRTAAPAAASRSATPRNLTWGMDLIFGAPEQTLDDWERDLERALAWRPHHVSVYGMTVHDGTRFAERRRKGQLHLPDEETQREMFLRARRRLTAAGYEHYEISNYALPGFRGRHNERYWTGGDYLGLGVAAHSFIGGARWANPADMTHYRDSLQAGGLPRRIEPPPEGRARLGEQVMLGLRRLEGIDLEAFRQRFGSDLTGTHGGEIERLSEAGFLEIAAGHLRLTEEGLLVADAVMAEFF